MLDYSISSIVQGAQFSPSLAIAQLGIQLEDTIEVGEIIPKGRFAGVPSPYGAATIRIDGLGPYGKDLKKFLKLLKANINKLKSLGGKINSVHMSVFYDEQCNLEISPQELKMISEMGLSLGISCCEGLED